MKKGKIIKYSMTSELMNVFIKYGDEDFHFNLFSELQVDENTINHEIQNQPSAYAFLGMLYKKLKRVAADKKREMEKSYSIMFIRYKGNIDPQTNRQTANDLAKEKAIASVKYQNSVKNYIEADHECDILEVCVKSFEQRSALIQTLSANIRKTN